MNIQDYKRKNHEIPRLLVADAYTIGSNDFESEEAKKWSNYYITARRFLDQINPDLYLKEDTRYILSGLPRIIDYLLFEPITLKEIDEADRFLMNAKVTTKGLAKFNYPRELWLEIVFKHNGRIPIEIKGLPDGSVFYPQEPIVEINNLIDGFGVLSAWFESKTLQLWASTEMTTQLEHWKLYYVDLIKKIYGDGLTEEEIDFKAGLMLHNFGDRAGICPQESVWLGETACLSFSGTDTFAGGYQYWKNSNEQLGGAISVPALAHRNVQSYKTEYDCYRALYNHLNDGDIGSFVADLNNFEDAILRYSKNKTGINENCLLGLALESKKTDNGKIVTCRPDSGCAIDQILWLCNLAVEYGLYEEVIINDKSWLKGTTLKFIEGDGMTWGEMRSINEALLNDGFLPWEWGLYGVGGGLRNHIKRDNSGLKYALCSLGEERKSVVKFSETPAKSTLGGPFKLLRSKEALDSGITIVHESEIGEDARLVYYNGLEENFFGDVMFENNLDTKDRVKEQLKTMPKRLINDVPASQKLLDIRLGLVREHAPSKLKYFI